MAGGDQKQGGGAVAPLERKMGLTGVLFLTLSAATPASSVFVFVPDVIRQAGTGALWAMLGAAGVAVVVAMVYGELASAFPNAGGEYAVVARVLGPTSGFAMLAVNLANLLLVTAVLALGVADYLRAAWPDAQPVPTALLAVAAAAFLSVLNIRASAWLTGLFLLVELGALGVVTWLGFTQPERWVGGVLLHPVHAAVQGGLAAASLGTLALAATVGLSAYDGYGSAIYLAEEMKAPRRRVARAVGLALALIVLTELGPLTAVLTGAPDLARLLADASPFADFVTARAGAAVSTSLRLAVALAIFNALVALVLLTARQLYATGRDGVWGGPVDVALVRLHPRWRSPWVATLAAGVVSALLCLCPLRLLLMLSGAGVIMIYLGLCIALLVGRRTGATAQAKNRAPLAPLLVGAAAAVLLTILVIDFMDAEEGRPSLIATLAIAGTGALAGRQIGKSGRWRATAPVDDAVAG